MIYVPVKKCRECPCVLFGERDSAECCLTGKLIDPDKIDSICPYIEKCSCTRSGGIDEDIQPIIDALEHLVFLHGCEQEGLESGMPTPEQWEQAVDAAHRALKNYQGDNNEGI